MRHALALIAALCTFGVVAGCSHDSAIHAQSASSSEFASASASIEQPTAPTETSSAPVTGQATPLVEPVAQSAVNAYMAQLNLLAGWGRTPQAANASLLAPYVTTTVLTQTMAAFAGLVQDRIAYRGTPDQSHVTILTATSSVVTFWDCMTPSATDPYTQYHVDTGLAVPSSAPAGLHPKAITMLSVSGAWKMSSDVPSLATTCTP